jgi:hypothetical protein
MSNDNHTTVKILPFPSDADAITQALSDSDAIDSLLSSDVMFDIASGMTVEQVAQKRQMSVEAVKSEFCRQARRWRQAREDLIDLLYSFDVARIEVLLNRLMALASKSDKHLSKLSQLIVDIIMKKSMISMSMNYASQVRNTAALRTSGVREKLKSLEDKIRSWDSEEVVKKSVLPGPEEEQK